MDTLGCLKMMRTIFGEEIIWTITKQWLSSLSDTEEKILVLRFGLEDGRSCTLQEVGQELNVTRERIRQIEAKALRKIREQIQITNHFYEILK